MTASAGVAAAGTAAAATDIGSDVGVNSAVTAAASTGAPGNVDDGGDSSTAVGGAPYPPPPPSLSANADGADGGSPMGRRRPSAAAAATARVSTPRLALMVSADLGLSFCWVLKYALATPHLAHTLGASAAVSHALWALGPLTGLLAPLIGTLSDRHASRHGRRRPFVAAGAVASVVGMTVFAWAGSALPAGRSVATAVAFAGFGLWDVGLQAMLFPSRALLADVLPADRQHDVQAVAAVLAGVAEVAAGGLVWSIAEPVASIRSLLAGGAVVLLVTTAVSLVLCVEAATDGSARGEDVELATVGGGDSWWEGNNGGPRGVGASSVATPFLGVPPPNGDHASGGAGGDAQEGPRAGGAPRSGDIGPPPPPSASRSTLAATVASMAALPPTVARVVVVYALAWFSFFCTLPYFSAWLGTSVLGGSPSAARGTPAADAYQAGVTIFSAASVVKAVAGLAFGGCYPTFLRGLGGGGERTLLSGPLGAYAVVLWAVAGTRSGWVAGAAVAAAAVPFVVTQTIPVAMVVTPPGGDAAGAGGRGVNLGVLNLACVLPQLLDTAYTGWVAGRWGEAAVLRIGGGWAAAAALAAFVLL